MKTETNTRKTGEHLFAHCGGQPHCVTCGCDEDDALIGGERCTYKAPRKTAQAEITNQPTLCLVMDGEKIVSYEVTSSELETIHFKKWKTGFGGFSYTLLTIPLSLCALAPEMKKELRSFLVLLGVLQEEYVHKDSLQPLEFSEDGALARIKSLLSRIKD